MHGSRGSVERKSSTVTADRDAFAKTKPCVEVFTGYQRWRKRGRKAGLGCNGAQSDEADEGISLTVVSSGGTTQGKRESNSAMSRRTQSCVQTSFAGAERMERR